MGERYSYEQLKRAAVEARAELFLKGLAVPKRKIRRKPRDPEKRALLYRMAMDRLEIYRPFMRNGKIVLPYFFQQKD